MLNQLSVKFPTYQDGDSDLQLSALILSSVLWLQVQDLQGIIRKAEPTPLPLWFHCAISEPGEDGLPPPSFPPVKPPLFEFVGQGAGKQQRPACRHHKVLT